MPHQSMDYATQLRLGGFRLTPQRELILDAVCCAGGHTTTEEVFSRVRSKAPVVSRATIYRTLGFFCEQGLVISADLGDGHKVYEVARKEPHHHLVCRSCGRIDDLGHELVQDLYNQIESKQQFHVNTDHLVFFGICESCQQQEANNS